MTSPLVILGALGIIVSSFSSRIQPATTFEDSFLLGGLEETERAEDAVTGLDQVVAGEAGQLAELGDEGLSDLARELRRAIRSTPS